MSKPSATQIPQTPQNPDNLWNLDYSLTLLTSHFMFVGYVSQFTSMPLYVLDRGGEVWQIGIVVGSFGVVSLVVRPFAGRWIYQIGPKLVAVVGTAIIGIANLLYIAATGVWWLVPVRVLQGVGMAMGPVATATIVANLAPANRRAEAMAYMGNSIASSGLYAPVVAFLLLAAYGFHATFLFSASCALLGAALAMGISGDRTGISRGETPASSVPLVSRGAIFPTVIFLTFTTTTGPVTAFLPLLAEARELGNPGLYFTVNGGTTIAAMWVSGPLADRIGRASVIIPGLVLTATSMFLLAVASDQAAFLGAAVLTGTGFGLLQPGIQSLTVDRVPPQERSSAMATLQAPWDIGGYTSSFILGPIAGVFGVASTFVIVGAGAILGAAGFAVGNARMPTPLPRQRDANISGRNGPR